MRLSTLIVKDHPSRVPTVGNSGLLSSRALVVKPFLVVRLQHICLTNTLNPFGLASFRALLTPHPDETLSTNRGCSSYEAPKPFVPEGGEALGAISPGEGTLLSQPSSVSVIQLLPQPLASPLHHATPRCLRMTPTYSRTILVSEPTYPTSCPPLFKRHCHRERPYEL